MLHGTWTASVRDIDGMRRATVEVLVAEQPADLSTLLEAATNTEVSSRR